MGPDMLFCCFRRIFGCSASVPRHLPPSVFGEASQNVSITSLSYLYQNPFIERQKFFNSMLI